ncbi:Zn(2)-C6 fungal-type transcriptional factor [Favolaschia claudopus]|uniref:Zn(2)-C6 fungal-type transcriptional factor n=1 Tax=Favolaschia claudopus TaxID=2862362 RepID=A0AAW0DAL7_9AGAR
MSLVRNKRKKKPPACDACKARRVLCHSQPDGIACPRCIEKGVVCKTTPVQRGRPRYTGRCRRIQSPSSSTCKEPLLHSSPTINPPHPLTNVPSELPPDLVKHLFECFELSLEFRHPLIHGNKIQAALATARVLGSCICAIASSISFHPAIIGWPYGVRRASMVRALSERAFTLAFQAGTYLDVSETNAASCFCLDTLERVSRAWGCGLRFAFRIVAGSQESEKPWRMAGLVFLKQMFEALAALLRRTPKLLESLQAMVASSRKLSNIIYSAIRPCLLVTYTTTLPEVGYLSILHYARRRAVAETAIIQFLAPFSLVLALHKEVQYRNAWGTLQRQVQELTSLAVGDVVRALQLLPSLPHLGMLDPSSIQDWICFCLDEAAIAGLVNSARAKNFETFISSLKLLGYCYVIPRSAELIERMEFYVGQHQLSSPSLAPAQLFPMDDAWTGMFHLDLMQCVPSSSLRWYRD